eukprot:Skav233594  [mRNA]  locus=scaffold2520:644137:644382:+ [translate_table: standard]
MSHKFPFGRATPVQVQAARMGCTYPSSKGSSCATTQPAPTKTRAPTIASRLDRRSTPQRQLKCYGSRSVISGVPLMLSYRT